MKHILIVLSALILAGLACSPSRLFQETGDNLVGPAPAVSTYTPQPTYTPYPTQAPPTVAPKPVAPAGLDYDEVADLAGFDRMAYLTRGQDGCADDDVCIAYQNGSQETMGLLFINDGEITLATAIINDVANASTDDAVDAGEFLGVFMGANGISEADAKCVIDRLSNAQPGACGGYTLAIEVDSGDLYILVSFPGYQSSGSGSSL